MSYILQETNIPKAVLLVHRHCIYESVMIEDRDFKTIVKEAEKLSYIAFAIETGNIPGFSSIERFIEQFFLCCKVSGLSFNWLQKLYIGKNALNQFRQDNGYKEGKYIKSWNGREDNVIMLTILEVCDYISYKDIYNKLEKEYQKLS